MITSGKIFKVVKKFERVLPFAEHENALNMQKGRVSDRNDGHQCGTIHCHAGWYLLAKKWDLKSHYLDDGSGIVSYLGGVVTMCRDLGFDTENDLLLWAKWNPEIWGNEYGERMFCSSLAFNYEEGLTLQKIVDHWGEVGMRLLIAELYQREVQNDNI